MNHYPLFIQNLEKVDNELFKIAKEKQDLIMRPGSLDVKTKFLILLSLDVLAGSSGVKGISEAARKAGASEEEIIESLRIAYLVAGNKVLNTSMNAFN